MTSSQLPIKAPAGFRVIAHRGASAYAPENCAPAFKLANDMGVCEVELDTQLTTDDEIVLCHDLSLQRYGHGDARVESMTWTELSQLDMGNWLSPFLFGGTRMLRLDDLFSMYADRFIYHVELKGESASLPKAVHRCIQDYSLHDNCLITSFNYDHLVAMQDIDDDARLGWLIDEIDDETIEMGRKLSLFQLCPRADTVSSESVLRARQHFSEIRAWGVNGDASTVVALVEQVIEAGCDGLTINWPDWVTT